MGIMTIELKELRFYAFHGLYGEEKKTGNEFEVSLCVDFDPVETVITNIAVTVNYARLYEIVKRKCKSPVLYWRRWQWKLSNQFMFHFHKLIKRIFL